MEVLEPDNDESENYEIDKLMMETTEEYQGTKGQSLEDASCDTMVRKVKCSEIIVNKCLMEELVSCDLSVDALIDVKRNDYVVIESVIVESHVKSFANVVVADAPEVFENFEVVCNKDVCVDEDLTVDMVNDEKALVDIGCIEDDVVLDAELVQIVDDNVAFVDVELGKVIEEDYDDIPVLDDFGVRGIMDVEFSVFQINGGYNF